MIKNSRPICQVARLIALLVLVIATSANSSAKPEDSLPAPVLKGLQAYAAEGLGAAVDIWMKNSVMDGNASAKAGLLQVAEVERYYGKYEDYQLVRVSILTPRSKRFYIAINYEKSPLWCYLDVYQKKNGEFIISELLFNTKAALILPGDFFYR